MEPSERNGAAIRKHIQDSIGSLVQSFESIIAEAQTTSRSGRMDPPAATGLNPRNGRTDLTASMDGGVQIDLTTQSMIRATEDLVVLIRQMQEMWLFGKLDTIRPTNEEVKEDELVDLVTQLIETGVKKREGKS